MRSRDPSPSRGKMTITLRTAGGAEPDETARVKIEVNNPELVAERVVNQLAKRFPPESVVTLAATNGGATTEDDETAMGGGTEDGETVSSERLASGNSWKGTHRRNHKLLPSDCGSVQCIKDLWLPQYYFVSNELDMAVPVCEHQERVRLSDRSSVPVSAHDVITVWHDETGHVTTASKGYGKHPPTVSAEIRVPTDNPGIGRFSQDFLISDDLERAVPLCPGQTHVSLIDGAEHLVNPQEVLTVQYGEKGLALFHKRPDGTVIPGVPSKAGIAYCAVAHRVRGSSASPLTVGRVPVRRDARPDIHVVLYDDTGLPICVRGPTGGLTPEGLTQKGAAGLVEYYYSPTNKTFPLRYSLCDRSEEDHRGRGLTARDHSARDDSIRPHKARGQTTRDRSSRNLRTLRARDPRDLRDARELRDSRDPHELSDLRDHRDLRHPRDDREHISHNYRDSFRKGSRSPLSKPIDSYYERDYRRNGPEYSRRPRGASPDRTSTGGWITETHTSSAESLFEEDYDEPNVRFNRRDRTSETYARCQTYFVPSNVDFAIPVQAEQAHVKLANGDKMMIKPSQTFTVDYDRRGFPMKTIYSDGATDPWMPFRQGIGAKFQDYFVHKDLVAAVPIRPGQTEVVLNDGSTVSVPDSNVMTVFYDSSGRAAFNISGSKKRIRPGLVTRTGVAHSVQYFNLIDAGDGSGEQFVVPFKAYQREVPDPRRPSRKVNIDRKAITVSFYDKAKKSLFTQLPDGTIVGGGLASSRLSTSEEFSSTFDDRSLLSGAEQDSFAFKIPYTERPRRISLGSPHNNISRTHRPPKRKETNPESQSARSFTDSVVRSKRQEIIEIRVPVQQVEYIDKVVEVPEVHYVDKHVEIEQIEWQTKIVKKKEVIERPVEHIKYVPKIETKIVEHILEKQEYIEVPVPKIIEQKKKVDRFVDSKKNITVQQTIRPVIKDTLEIFEDVECLTLEPELIPVDVFVPRLVKCRLIAVGTTKEEHKEVDVPLAHYNSLLLKLNPTFASNYEKLPMIKNASGSFPLLPSDQKVTVLAPTAEEITLVLKAAGVVSRNATQPEVSRLTTSGRRRSITDEESVDQFAPRTCVIDPFPH